MVEQNIGICVLLTLIKIQSSVFVQCLPFKLYFLIQHCTSQGITGRGFNQ